MIEHLTAVWMEMAANPLFNLTLTLLIFVSASYLYRQFNNNPLLNPVLMSIVVLVGLLYVTSTPYDIYFKGAQFLHFLLGPATVALAIPLYRQLERVKKSAAAILFSVLCGSITAAGTAIVITWLMGAQWVSIISIAPKSVTTPVAMGITEQLGGLPSLTAAIVILTGIIGAMFAPALLKLCGVEDEAAKGIAIGAASHGVGTARAIQISEVAGAFSGLAMGLNALATALLLPILWQLFRG
jgi:predicted murein hydrolase (TIGR00659 family)